MSDHAGKKRALSNDDDGPEPAGLEAVQSDGPRRSKRARKSIQPPSQATPTTRTKKAPTRQSLDTSSALENSIPAQPTHSIDPTLTQTRRNVSGSNATSNITVNTNFTASTSTAPSSSATSGVNPYTTYYNALSKSTGLNPYTNPYILLAHSPIMSPGMFVPSPSPFIPSPSTPQPPPSAPPPPQSDPSSSKDNSPVVEDQRAKQKRLKAHTVTSKNYNIPNVPRDKQGKPLLPLNVGIMTVINLGEICLREHFHTERYIYPVGYEVTRRYLSTVDSNAEVVYTCTILDGGDGPKFQIIPSDTPDGPIIAGTATGAWASIVKRANLLRQRQHSNSVSGPDFFGLNQNTIKHLIQGLPNAERLRDYVWQNYTEGGPLGGRHAAVIPALPDEYDDPAKPMGAFYPSEREKARREATLSAQAPSASGSRDHYPPHTHVQTPTGGVRQPHQHVNPPPPLSIPIPGPPTMISHSSSPLTPQQPQPFHPTASQHTHFQMHHQMPNQPQATPTNGHQPDLLDLAGAQLAGAADENGFVNMMNAFPPISNHTTGNG